MTASRSPGSRRSWRFRRRAFPRVITLTSKPLPEGCGSQRPKRQPSSPGRPTPYPLSEDLFLAAYQEGEQYAIYLIDTTGGRERIYADSTISCFDPIPLRPTIQPPVTASSIAGRGERSDGPILHSGRLSEQPSDRARHDQEHARQRDHQPADQFGAGPKLGQQRDRQARARHGADSGRRVDGLRGPRQHAVAGFSCSTSTAWPS